MKKPVFAFVLFLAVGFSLSLKAAPVVVADVLNVAWDYADSMTTASNVTKFQYAVTPLGSAATSWTDAAPNVTPIASMDDGTGVVGPGKNYKQSVTPVTVGDHTFHLRACNPDVCSVEVAVDFHFTATPRAALNLTLSGKS